LGILAGLLAKQKQIEFKLKVMGGEKFENAVQVSRILVQIARL